MNGCGNPVLPRRSSNHDAILRGSLNPNILRRLARTPWRGDLVPGMTRVLCHTLRDLCARHGVRPSVILIDSEGLDLQIVAQIALPGLAPTLFVYEHALLPTVRRAAAAGILEAGGYRTIAVGSNTLGVRDIALRTSPPLTACAVATRAAGAV